MCIIGCCSACSFEAQGNFSTCGFPRKAIDTVNGLANDVLYARNSSKFVCSTSCCSVGGQVIGDLSDHIGKNVSACTARCSFRKDPLSILRARASDSKCSLARHCACACSRSSHLAQIDRRCSGGPSILLLRRACSRLNQLRASGLSGNVCTASCTCGVHG